MGEYQIINELAKQRLEKGDSPYWASKNAVTIYNIAIKEAMEYEYIPKEEKEQNKKRAKRKRKEYKFKLSTRNFKGNWREERLVHDLVTIMNEDGFVLGFELIEYISDCINQEILLNEDSEICISRKKVFDYLQDEINRVIVNLEKQAMLDMFKGGVKCVS